MKTIRTVALFLLVATAGCGEAAKEKPDVTNTAAPAKVDISKLQLTDLDNNVVDMEQYKGKTVFVNFWATWCNPCIAEMPSIQKLQNRFKDDPIVFLLATDDDATEIKDFKNAHDYTFNYARLESLASMNIQAIPTTFIYAADGSLAFSETGSRNWADSASIQMILKIINQK